MSMEYCCLLYTYFSANAQTGTGYYPIFVTGFKGKQTNYKKITVFQTKYSKSINKFLPSCKF